MFGAIDLERDGFAALIDEVEVRSGLTLAQARSQRRGDRCRWGARTTGEAPDERKQGKKQEARTHLAQNIGCTCRPLLRARSKPRSRSVAIATVGASRPG